MRYLLVLLLSSGCYSAKDSIGLKGRIPKCKNHFMVSEKVPKELVPEIQKAMDVWNKYLKTDTFSLQYPAAVNFDNDGINTITWYTEKWPQSKQEQAVNTAFWVNNYITETDIRVNAQDYQFYIKKPKGLQVHFESLMIHELGHTLGFDHFPSTTSVMYHQLGYGEVRRELLPLGTIKCH